MSQISQDIRYAPINPENINNPQSLFPETKPSRIIITDGVPQQEDGQILWYAIDQNTGVLYNKTEESGGQWQGIYQFAGGAGSVTDGANVGIGSDIFKDKTGSTLNFKTLVSQPDPNESIVIIKDNLINTEVNLTAPQTVSSITNYGTPAFSPGWVVDSDSTTIDPNGNFQLFTKPIVAGTNISIDEITAGSDKYIQINNTATLEAPSYINAYINNLTQTIPNTYVNLNTIWNQTEISSDWTKFTDSGNTYWRYIGDAGKRFKLSADVYTLVTPLVGANENFIVALAQGISPQTEVPETGVILEVVRDAGGVPQRSNGSLNFIFEPAVNQLYTLVCKYNSGASKSITFEQIRWTIHKI